MTLETPTHFHSNSRRPFQ